MNTEILNADFVPMTQAELESTNGGLGFLATVAAGVLIAGATAVISDWKGFKAGVAEAF
ncbi:class IIb bacteriocin, lactobin A/cerein 7B family [Olivibacter sp. CPCC 100613]|uniref:class IIb bacteriocin, lactobin A/cerein 7B family n=1 Tax=Olivibacter sp. CPCC 100613 TaxID=3079931 RepID=UPI002FF7B314